MQILSQNLQTSNAPSVTFTIPADPVAQAAWTQWQDPKQANPVEGVAHIAVTFAILNKDQLEDGEYALWRRKLVDNVWIPDGGVTGSTKLDLLADGSQSLILDWDGQEYIGKITVATEFACTIEKLSCQVIYTSPVN